MKYALKLFAIASFLFLVIGTPRAVAVPPSDRAYTVSVMERIAGPVLAAKQFTPHGTRISN